MKLLWLGPLVFVGCAGTPPRPAAPPSIAGTYVQDGDCTGSPENRGCDTYLELAPDGTGSFIGDDIPEPITWQLEGEVIHANVPWGPTDFTIIDGGWFLRDNRYQLLWERRQE